MLTRQKQTCIDAEWQHCTVFVNTGRCVLKQSNTCVHNNFLLYPKDLNHRMQQPYREVFIRPESQSHGMNSHLLMFTKYHLRESQVHCSYCVQTSHTRGHTNQTPLSTISPDCMNIVSTTSVSLP